MGTLPTTVVIVIPCYNEAERLRLREFEQLLEAPDTSLLFVDDGSSDDTARILGSFAERHPGTVELLRLQANRGKAEAVRQGMLRALERDAAVVGFIDADMATPVEEVTRLARVALDSGADAVIGSRVARMGSEIDRSLGRHLLGRIFATAASLTLDATVYDTQCGAKFFANATLLRRVLDEGFHSRWAFDVELLGRLLAEGADIVELPLRRWIDVPGSKIGLGSMVKAGMDLVQIRRHLARRRKGR